MGVCEQGQQLMLEQVLALTLERPAGHSVKGPGWTQHGAQNAQRFGAVQNMPLVCPFFLPPIKPDRTLP